MLSSTETEKKLTLDLKTEVSGDFSKALLLLAEVTIMHMTVLCVYISSCFPFGVISSFFLYCRARGTRAPQWMLRRQRKMPRCNKVFWRKCLNTY